MYFRELLVFGIALNQLFFQISMGGLQLLVRRFQALVCGLPLQ